MDSFIQFKPALLWLIVRTQKRILGFTHSKVDTRTKAMRQMNWLNKWIQTFTKSMQFTSTFLGTRFQHKRDS